MRLDLFLKISRLIKQRSLAKKACEAGLISVDGSKAKPGSKVKEGQVVCIRGPNRLLEVRILRVPKRGVSRDGAKSLYEILRDERSAWRP